MAARHDSAEISSRAPNSSIRTHFQSSRYPIASAAVSRYSARPPATELRNTVRSRGNTVLYYHLSLLDYPALDLDRAVAIGSGLRYKTGSHRITPLIETRDPIGRQSATPLSCPACGLILLASNQTKNFYVTCDEYATLPAVVAHRRTVEIAVQGTQDVGTAYNGGVNDRVIVRVGRHDAGSRARENDLGDFLRPKITEIFGYLFVRQSR